MSGRVDVVILSLSSRTTREINLSAGYLRDLRPREHRQRLNYDVERLVTAVGW